MGGVFLGLGEPVFSLRISLLDPAAGRLECQHLFDVVQVVKQVLCGMRCLCNLPPIVMVEGAQHQVFIANGIWRMLLEERSQ